MEVLVSDQGSRFKCVLEQKVEGMSVFQQVTNTGSTLKRYNASIEEQHKLARESFEPQTEAENDELVVQGCISHHSIL